VRLRRKRNGIDLPRSRPAAAHLAEPSPSRRTRDPIRHRLMPSLSNSPHSNWNQSAPKDAREAQSAPESWIRSLSGCVADHNRYLILRFPRSCAISSREHHHAPVMHGNLPAPAEFGGANCPGFSPCDRRALSRASPLPSVKQRRDMNLFACRRAIDFSNGAGTMSVSRRTWP